MPRITENKGPTVYKNRQELIFRNEPKMYQNVPKCTRKVKRFKCIEIVPKCHFGKATINNSLPLICLNPNKGYKGKF